MSSQFSGDNLKSPGEDRRPGRDTESDPGGDVADRMGRDRIRRDYRRPRDTTGASAAGETLAVWLLP
jgi:hypothetical protein